MPRKVEPRFPAQARRGIRHIWLALACTLANSCRDRSMARSRRRNERWRFSTVRQRVPIARSVGKLFANQPLAFAPHACQPENGPSSISSSATARLIDAPLRGRSARNRSPSVVASGNGSYPRNAITTLDPAPPKLRSQCIAFEPLSVRTSATCPQWYARHQEGNTSTSLKLGDKLDVYPTLASALRPNFGRSAL